MAYSTLAQLTDRYSLDLLISLTDRAEPPTGGVVTAVLDRAISDTDALIDGYLAGRYALPLASVPALITALAEAITLYKLHTHVVGEKFATDYRDAIKTLERISAGTVRLSVAGAEPDGSSANEVRTNQPDRPFTPATMKGYI